MRTLIIYASKNGCTEDCARYLKEKLGKNAVVTNVENKIPKMDDFDTILIGSSVHMGKIQKKSRLFVDAIKVSCSEKSWVYLFAAIQKRTKKDLSNHYLIMSC